MKILIKYDKRIQHTFKQLVKSLSQFEHIDLYVTCANYQEQFDISLSISPIEVTTISLMSLPQESRTYEEIILEHEIDLFIATGVVQNADVYYDDKHYQETLQKLVDNSILKNFMYSKGLFPGITEVYSGNNIYRLYDLLNEYGDFLTEQFKLKEEAL